MLLLGPSRWCREFLIRQLSLVFYFLWGNVSLELMLGSSQLQHHICLQLTFFPKVTHVVVHPVRVKWKNTKGPSLLKKSVQNGLISWQVAFPPFFYSMASGDVSLSPCSWSKGWSWIQFWHWADFLSQTVWVGKNGDGCCWIWLHCHLHLPPTSGWWVFASDG